MMETQAIIIGGGPAGLSGACYLGRFRRPCIILDGRASRARWIPKSHNTPGFPTGVSGEELLARLRDQATRYGSKIIADDVLAVTRNHQGFTVQGARDQYRSNYVMLATGVKDNLPKLVGTEEAICRGLLRICPICDAFEIIDKHVGVLGTGDHAVREAEFLRTYTERITFLNIGKHSAALQSRIEAGGISYRCARLETVVFHDGGVTVRDNTGNSLEFQTIYSALGCHPMNQLAAQLGAKCDEQGALTVNAHQETSIQGLYAAGDVVRGVNQIVVAAAEAAIAATDIHNKLRLGSQLELRQRATVVRPESEAFAL